MNFQLLTETIQQTHEVFYQQTIKSINRNLTLRNWLMGYYIVEYEQQGEDRAAYGTKLLTTLAEKVSIRGISETSLKLCRQFYLAYPNVFQLFKDDPSFGSTSASLRIRQSAIDELENSNNSPFAGLSPEKLISQLSFTHLSELFPIKDRMKRMFYEVECIKGSWSVSELKRQIGSLYFERMNLSNDPEKMAMYVQEKIPKPLAADLVKDHHFFEFLGIADKSFIEETDLEQALLNHLQEFILELGNGFCFEARQKRIIIGGEYFYVDIVFYHRILKCHVLVELKVEPFNYANIGQLNTYVNFYKQEMMLPDDNPPVGILLITDKNNALVEYATAGVDNQLFVSKYQLQLPTKDQLANFVKNELKKM